MSEWSNMTFKDIAEFNPRESIKKGEVTVKIGMDKLQPFCRDIAEVEYEEFSGGAKFRNNDTIMARITPCLENGKIAMVNVLADGQVGFGSTEYIVFRAKDGISDSYFLYYLVCSPAVREPAIKSMVGSSGRQRVQTDVVQNLELLIPALDEQKKIGEFLKKLDDKIAVNNKINRNLTQQFRAIVDNFVEQLDEFELKRLDEVAECQNGHAFYKEGYDEEGAFVIDLGNVNTSANFVYTNADKYISLERYEQEKLEKYRVYKDDLVMVMTDRKSTMELLGKTGKVYKDGYYILNQRMYRIRAKEGINVNYLYAILNSTKVCNGLKEKALGSVQKYVNTKEINEIEVILPSPVKMDELAQVVNPISSQMETNILENENLQKLRDELLPKLMSGELDVSDLE